MNKSYKIIGAIGTVATALYLGFLNKGNHEKIPVQEYTQTRAIVPTTEIGQETKDYLLKNKRNHPIYFDLSPQAIKKIKDDPDDSITPQDLESILKDVNSEKRRAEIVYKLAGNVAIPKVFAEEAIAYYENKNELYCAARIAKKAGLQDKARRLYSKLMVENERDENFYLAADAAVEAGLPNTAKELYAKALEDSLKKGKLWMAAQCAEGLGLKNKAEKFKKLDKILE